MSDTEYTADVNVTEDITPDVDGGDATSSSVDDDELLLSAEISPNELIDVELYSDEPINTDVRDSVGSTETDHRLLTHRDAPNQHPIAAITGLNTTLQNMAASIDSRLTADENGIILLQVDVDGQSVRLATVEGDVDSQGDRITTVEGDVVTAGGTATKYLTPYVTALSSQGIKLHAQDTATLNYITLDGDSGVTVYKSGINTAQFSDTARLGRADSYHTKLDSNGLHVWSGAESTATNEKAVFGSTMRIGATNSGNVFVESDKIKIRNGTTVLSEFSGSGLTTYVSGTKMSTFDSTGMTLYSQAYGEENQAIASLTSSDLWFYEGGYEIGRINHNIYNGCRYFRFMEEYNQKIWALLNCNSENGYSRAELVSQYGYIGNVNKAELMLVTNATYAPNLTVNLYEGGSDNPSISGYMYLSYNGKLYASGGYDSSDAKKKDVVGDVDFAEDLIMGLRPIEFQWKKSSHKRTHMGFIAQEMAALGEELGKDLSVYDARYEKEFEEYHGEKVDDSKLTWHVNYSELIPPIVKVIQEQNKRIKELERRLS